MTTVAATLQTAENKANPLLNSRKCRPRHHPITVKHAVSLGIFCILVLYVSAGIAYGCISAVAAAVSKVEGIRAALASYAADSPGNRYPPTSAIASYDDLRRIVNANGGTLPQKEPAPESFLAKTLRIMLALSQVIMGGGTYDGPACPPVRSMFVNYTSDDGLSYTLTFRVKDVPDTLVGKIVVATPEGVSTRE